MHFDHGYAYTWTSFQKMGAIMTRDGSLLPNDYDYSRLLHIFTNESS